MKHKNIVMYMFKTACSQKPVLFLCYFLDFVQEILRKVQYIIVPKFLLDELVAIYNGTDVSVHIRQTVIFAICAVGIQFFANLLMSISNRVKSLCDEYFNEYFQVEINDYAMGIDFELTENPEALNQLNKAKEGMSWYSGNVCGILDNFFAIITNIFVFAGVIAVIFKTAPMIVPIEIVTIGLTALFNRKIRKIELKTFEGLSKFNRIFGYIFYQLSNFDYGKDIRLYNSADLFTEKSKEHLDNQLVLWQNQADSTKKQQYCINVVDALSNFGTYFYVGVLAVRKLISIGDFSMCISASGTLTTSCANIVKAFQEIIKRSKYAEEYLKFIEYPQVKTKGTLEVKNQKEHEIEFRNVYFKYPNSEKMILKNVNLKIPNGQHVAIVGLNGEGKTTLIKLLCRLYDVTDGEILIDGINIKDYKDEDYRNLFAVLFQDFKIFAFSVKENVAFDSEAADEKVNKALELAGLNEYVQSLPKKTDTCINKSFDKYGTEFSGGQKQKVGIARALYKDSPIIILDEPTAALDPIAEEDIYSKFNNSLAGGKTAIYISHRLSSCKFCDKIAVISEGTIKEYGNHKELMQLKDGIYCKMFTTQAKQYR